MSESGNLLSTISQERKVTEQPNLAAVSLLKVNDISPLVVLLAHNSKPIKINSIFIEILLIVFSNILAL